MRVVSHTVSLIQYFSIAQACTDKIKRQCSRVSPEKSVRCRSHLESEMRLVDTPVGQNLTSYSSINFFLIFLAVLRAATGDTGDNCAPHLDWNRRTHFTDAQNGARGTERWRNLFVSLRAFESINAHLSLIPSRAGNTFRNGLTSLSDFALPETGATSSGKLGMSAHFQRRHVAISVAVMHY